MEETALADGLREWR